MIDTNIKEFCRVVTRISELSQFLEDEKRSFYDREHSFEEVYSDQINELADLQKEFLFVFTVLKIKTAN